MKLTPHLVALSALSFAAVHPATAAVVADHQFNTEGDTEGWVDRGVGSGNDGLTSDGECLTATSPGLDPQLIFDGTLGRAANAEWDTVTFRIRETEEAGGEAIEFDPTGTVVQIDGGRKIDGGMTVSQPDGFSVEESGDGFYTVTVSIAPCELETISELRIDPIGGSLKNSNSDTAGNTYEIDFIQVTDTSADASEPG